MGVEKFYKTLSEHLQDTASVKTVYGDPIEAHDKTVIPVSQVSFAFGGGPSKLNTEGDVEAVLGGGGAVHARPVGVLEITSEGTRFIPSTSWTHLAGVFLAGLVVGLLIRR